jgi:predicted Zn-dependent peptidase
VLGNVPFSRVVKLVEKATADVPAASACHAPQPLPDYVPEVRTAHHDTHQAHVVMGNRCYGRMDPRRQALFLLSNLLGGPGMNSLLNVSLREKHGLVYTVDCSSFHYSDSGVWSVYFGCDEDDVERCRSLVLRQLDQLREEPLSTARLNAAKKQTVGQLLLNCDHFGSYAIAMGKAFARYGEHRDVDDTIRKIRALTAEDLMEVARDIFREDRLTTLIYK